MLTLGIDPGTSCGWAALDASGARIASGVWSLAPRRHEGGGMRYLRFRRLLTEAVDDLYLTLPPGSALVPGAVAVAYEEVRRHLGTDAAHVYGGILAALQMVCEERRVPYQGVAVATVKRLATGKGNANKSAMMAAARTRWPTIVPTEDEADALWIAEAFRRGLA